MRTDSLEEAPESLVSMEVRWFTDQDLPLSVPMLKEQEPKKEFRNDQYLILPEATSVGAKLRDRNLEIKYLVQDYGIIQISSNATGRAAVWRKISFPIPPDIVLDKVVLIKKCRWLYGFGIDDRNRAYPASFSNLPALNFNIEFCHLETNNKDWWSICLAAYGDRGKLMHCLKIACDYVAAEVNGLDLRVDNSLSFPQWLSLIT
jgi:hypothetical protein